MTAPVSSSSPGQPFLGRVPEIDEELFATAACGVEFVGAFEAALVRKPADQLLLVPAGPPHRHVGSLGGDSPTEVEHPDVAWGTSSTAVWLTRATFVRERQLQPLERGYDPQ